MISYVRGWKLIHLQMIQAIWTNAFKQCVMSRDLPTTLAGCSGFAIRGYWHANVNQRPALSAMGMIVAIGSLVEPTGLISERQFLYQIVFCQKMQGSVHRAIRYRWKTLLDSLENLASCQVTIGTLNLFEDDRTLSCISICTSNGVGHVSLRFALCFDQFRIAQSFPHENDSRSQSLVYAFCERFSTGSIDHSIPNASISDEISMDIFLTITTHKLRTDTGNKCSFC